MEYGTGAIYGTPAHDQRDLDFVNKYGLGNVPVVCPEDEDPKTFVITDVAYDGDGRMINSRFLDGMTIAQAKEEVAAGWRKRRTATGRPPSARSTSACATGAFRGSATGVARSRSSTAPPAASCRCRPRTCRSSCPTTSISTSRAIRSTAIRPGSTSPARNAAARRGAKPTPWTLRRIRPGISRASPIPGSRPRRPTARRSMRGCRSISTSAASSTRFCTCSTAASSPAR